MVRIRVRHRARPPILRTLVGLAVAAAAVTVRAADDPLVARSLAATCAACHGTDGRAQGAMQVLAGMPASRIVAAMRAFRSGEKAATVMHQIAKGYTDEQIERIADYFASRQPQ